MVNPSPNMTTDVDPDRGITVGVTGTHSTGKSTFLARLAHELRLRHFDVATVSDLGEEARRIGMPILFNHTWASTMWFITRGMSNELEAWLHADVLLIDRPIPDALGYYRAALEYREQVAHPKARTFLENMVRDHSRHYDLVFRTELDPMIPLGSNKERDDNARFRRLADQHIKGVLDELQLPYQPLPAEGHDEAIAQAVNLVTQRANAEFHSLLD